MVSGGLTVTIVRSASIASVAPSGSWSSMAVHAQRVADLEAVHVEREGVGGVQRRDVDRHGAEHLVDHACALDDTLDADRDLDDDLGVLVHRQQVDVGRRRRGRGGAGCHGRRTACRHRPTRPSAARWCRPGCAARGRAPSRRSRRRRARPRSRRSRRARGPVLRRRPAAPLPVFCARLDVELDLVHGPSSCAGGPRHGSVAHAARCHAGCRTARVCGSRTGEPAHGGAGGSMQGTAERSTPRAGRPGPAALRRSRRGRAPTTDSSSNTALSAEAMIGAIERTTRLSGRRSGGIGSVLVTTTVSISDVLEPLLWPDRRRSGGWRRR